MNYEDNEVNNIGYTFEPFTTHETFSYQSCWLYCSLSFPPTGPVGVPVAQYAGLVTNNLSSEYQCICYQNTPVYTNPENTCAVVPDPAFGDNNYYKYGSFNSGSATNSIMAIVECS